MLVPLGTLVYRFREAVCSELGRKPRRGRFRHGDPSKIENPGIGSLVEPQPEQYEGNEIEPPQSSRDKQEFRQIFIKNLNGATLTFVVSGYDTIEEIKSKIEESWWDIASDQQRLIFERGQLENGRSLNDYNICNNSTLFMVKRLRGGGGGHAISVKLPGGETIRMDVNDGDTVHDLKHQLQVSEGISVSEQILTAKGRELHDSDTFCVDYLDYIIRLVVKAPATEDPSKLWSPSALEEEARFRVNKQTKIQNWWKKIVSQDSTSTAVTPIEKNNVAISVIEPVNVENEVANGSLPTSPQNRARSPALISATTTAVIICSASGCEKVFKTQDELTRHVRYHNRPEQCPHCPRRFGIKTHLSRHINGVHRTTDFYYCHHATCKYSRSSGAGKFFSRKDALMRHLGVRHK